MHLQTVIGTSPRHSK